MADVLPRVDGRGVSDPHPTAFCMRLLPGNADEYRQRHDTIWPELAELLKKSGVSAYSIHLDQTDGVSLFAVMTLADDARYAALEHNPVMRRWWDYMADLMETDSANRPLTFPLARMFDLP